MSQLLRKGRRWEWRDEQKEAFDQLKTLLTKAPVLACPDFSRKFALQTNASDFGLGGVLTQETEKGERVIAYVCRRLIKAEENYSATKKECQVIIIRKLRCYLEGYRFDVITDHLALKWLKPNGPDCTMGLRTPAKPVRLSLPKRQPERGGGRLVQTADGGTVPS